MTKIFIFYAKSFNFDQTYLDTGLKTQNVEELSLDLISYNNFWYNVKSFSKQNSKLRIHSQLDRNQSKLTVCIGSSDRDVQSNPYTENQIWTIIPRFFLLKYINPCTYDLISPSVVNYTHILICCSNGNNISHNTGQVKLSVDIMMMHSFTQPGWSH